MSIWKYCFAAILTGSLILTACDQKPKNPVSDYGSALLGAPEGHTRVSSTANLDAVRKCIGAYRAANGKVSREPQGY